MAQILIIIISLLITILIQIIVEGSILKNSSKLWPFGIIPVRFENSVPGITVHYFRCALDKIQNQTDLKIYEITSNVEKNDELNVLNVKFTPLQLYCSSSVGFFPTTYGKRNDSKSPFVNIGVICRYGGILHELCHVIGAQHTHQRLDRDQFIQINWENLKSHEELNSNQIQWDFGLNNQKIFTHFDLPYDFSSIMHYGRNYRGFPDIIKPFNVSYLKSNGHLHPYEGHPEEIGQWNKYNWDNSGESVWKNIELSPGDVKLINQAYKDNIKDRNEKLAEFEEFIKNVEKNGNVLEKYDCF